MSYENNTAFSLIKGVMSNSQIEEMVEDAHRAGLETDCCIVCEVPVTTTENGTTFNHDENCIIAAAEGYLNKNN